MSIDTSLIGRLAAELMGDLPEETEGQIVGVGIVAVVDLEDETYTRIKCWPEQKFAQLGLFHDALAVVEHGADVEED